jgi:hypothetical protein
VKYYLLSVMQPVGEPPPPTVLVGINHRLNPFHEELREAGAWVFAGGLHGPEASTVVRPEEGRTLVAEGPYAEGEEFLGGVSIVRAPDLDGALDWGRKAALAIGLPIEVRPFLGEADD